MLRLDDAGRALLTHTNQPVTAVNAWWLDDAGSLYAVTPAGPGIVLDRDLPALLDQLRAQDGAMPLDALAELTPGQPPLMVECAAYGQAPLRMATRADLPRILGFEPAAPAAATA